MFPEARTRETRAGKALREPWPTSVTGRGLPRNSNTEIPEVNGETSNLRGQRLTQFGQIGPESESVGAHTTVTLCASNFRAALSDLCQRRGQKERPALLGTARDSGKAWFSGLV